MNKYINTIIIGMLFFLSGCGQPQFNPNNISYVRVYGKPYKIPSDSKYIVKPIQSKKLINFYRQSGLNCKKDSVIWMSPKAMKTLSNSKLTNYNAGLLMQAYAHKKEFGCANPINEKEYQYAVYIASLARQIQAIRQQQLQNFAKEITASLNNYTANARRTQPISYNSLTSNSSSGCNSDYDCGIGGRCIKKTYSSRGICMTNVNSYGNKQYTMPSMSSYGVNMNTKGQCSGMTDCPIGFNCDREYKVCIME